MADPEKDTKKIVILAKTLYKNDFVMYSDVQEEMRESLPFWHADCEFFGGHGNFLMEFADLSPQQGREER